MFSSLSPAAHHVLGEIFKTQKYPMNHVQTPPCFSVPSLTNLNADLWPASAQICACHQWETSAEHTEKAAAGAEFSVTAGEASPPSQHRTQGYSADSGLTVSLCFHDYDLKLRS